MLSKIYLFLAFGILMYFAFSLGKQILQTQKLNNELRILNEKKKENDRSYETAFQLANIYFQKGMYTEAIENYTYCLEIWEKSDRLGITFLLNRLVLTYYRLKENSIAFYYCKNALRVIPSSTQSLINLNRLYDASKINSGNS